MGLPKREILLGTEKSNEFVGPVPVAIIQFIEFYVGTIFLILLFMMMVVAYY